MHSAECYSRFRSVFWPEAMLMGVHDLCSFRMFVCKYNCLLS